MADEKFDTEQEELDSVVEQAEELAEETVEAADDALEAAEAETTVVDERVEAAVRHVAEEAAAEADNAVEADEAPERKKRERRSKQARAAKAERAGETAEAEVSRQPAKVGGLAGLGVPAWCGISVVCLALGMLLGRFVLGGGSSNAAADLTGVTTVSEEQLASPIATYTYDGKEEVVTVQEVIEQTSTLEDAKTEDGTYTLPSAEYAITVARNKILLGEVESRGITVSDEDVTAYAEEYLGTADFEALGSTYGMEADMVKQLIEENCRINALREEIVGAELPDMPDYPEAPEEGQEDKATKAYAKYIIKLVGDEWDKDADTWADKEGRYATALADYEVSKKGATYEAAETAYYLAYQIYTEQQTEINDKWTEYYNGLMSKASIQVGTLVS